MDQPDSRALLALLVAGVLALSAGCSCRPPEGCATSRDCPSRGFCAGPSSCVAGSCREGPGPCAPSERCIEASRTCVPAVGLDAGLDAALADSGPCPLAPSGLACDLSCSSGECNAELASELPQTTRVDGTRGRPLRFVFAPSGYCAPQCDPSRLNDECAPCAVCSGEALAGTTRIAIAGTAAVPMGFCRERCTPSLTGTGCPRAGYTCDLETGSCMEACTGDDQCQIIVRDGDGDGRLDYFDRGAEHPAYCDRVTGRCRTPGTPGARIGDDCLDDPDCEDDGTCLRRPGAERGVCTRLGCRAPGFGCPAGSHCDLRNGAASACLLGCEVGAEDGTPAMLGSGGGHPDCGAGLACVWDGSSERGQPLGGSCTPGVYNDISTPNIGALCTSSAECYSPFGLGTCLSGSYYGIGTGICSVSSCSTFLGASGEMEEGLLPGVSIEAPICDPARGELCVNLGPGDEAAETYCLQRCTTAETCAPGYACVELAPSRSACWPTCIADFECAPGSFCSGYLRGAPCDLETDRYCTCQVEP